MDGFLTSSKYLGPGFRINGSKVDVLNSCTEFYESIIERIKNAQNRVILSALYFGTDNLTSNVMEAISDRLAHSDVEVKIVSDFLRSSRNDGHYSKIFKTANPSNSPNFQYYLFTASGTNIERLPASLREIYGVHHMKFMIFDDSVIITGANLSETYLSNRHDRYYILNDCKDICDYLELIVDTLSPFCYKVLNNGDLESPLSNISNSNMDQYVQSIKTSIETLMSREASSSENSSIDDEADTIIYPTIQYGKSNMTNINDFLAEYLEFCSKTKGLIHLTSAYINFDQKFLDKIDTFLINDSKIEMILPNPLTNSFHNSGYIKSHVSGMYALFIKKLVEKYSLNSKAGLYEYTFSGQSYHAKGIWFTKAGENWPNFTVIGSSNFNERSRVRDLELNFALHTTNQKLRKLMATEINTIKQNITQIQPSNFEKSEYSVPLFCYALQHFAKSYF